MEIFKNFSCSIFVSFFVFLHLIFCSVFLLVFYMFFLFVLFELFYLQLFLLLFPSLFIFIFFFFFFHSSEQIPKPENIVIDLWVSVHGEDVRNGPFEGDILFFHFSIFLHSLCSCISFTNVSLLAPASNFNKRCFLRSRCSMEQWCPDDIGRDSWDWVESPAWERA